PLTPNGKVDRQALPTPDLASNSHYEPPQGEVEEALAEIWSEILGIELVGRHDNFFELGGHSLLALKVQARVEESFDTRLPLRSYFGHASLISMCTLIQEARESTREAEGSELEKMAALLESLES
ncbi:phosphopantetheine-binding protein, partial [Halomonas sp. AOP25-F1-15]|uniref:phosphopantetheine-binding protein n=1 Tax=Halomonas sp. AOP25-F1-15 TaxID=3457709 RepID=UPI0040344AF2